MYSNVYTCNEEIPIIDIINRLMKNEEYDEAKKLVQELQGYDEIVRVKFLADIAKQEGNMELEKIILEYFDSTPS